jgi:alanine dehydrogenase
MRSDAWIMMYCASPERDLDLKEVNAAIEEAFAAHGRGEVVMPPKMYVMLPHGDFRTMPAYLPALNIAGVKIVNVHPQNREFGLPTVMALLIILDVQTGKPEAVINATRLTDMRTGAAGAVAAKHLSPRREITLGIIGSGRQAEAQVNAISQELAIQQISVWSRDVHNAERFAGRFSHIGAEVTSLERACDCDVLVTTTPSRSPVVRDAWVHEGTHINAIGADAPGKQELEPALVKRSRVFVDDMSQAVHSGEINVLIHDGLLLPEEIAGTLGQVVLGKKRRESRDEITIFDSTGLAIQDLAIAALALRNPEGIDLAFL